MSTQIDDLRMEFELLRTRVENIAQSRSVDLTPAPQELPIVQQISREIFGVNPIFKLEQELECEGSYIVVELPAIGTEEEIHQRSREWHRRIAEHRPHLSSYALSLRYN
jgi:hypothetical protein